MQVTLGGGANVEQEGAATADEGGGLAIARETLQELRGKKGNDGWPGDIE